MSEEIMQRPVTDISQFSPSDVKNQISLIQQIMKDVMKEGEHYGIIPGCQKPSLLKPGAEKLGLTFRLEPEYQIYEQFLEKGHYYVRITCILKHILTGQRWGDGLGSCSTLESKYRYRNKNRVCPKCNQETIIAGKQEFGGGFICWTKKGGCGAKFPEGDVEIINQQTGKTENEDIADVYNTILKMAKKRAHVDAMLTATAASDIFTQDIEDMNGEVKLEKEIKPTKEVKQTANKSIADLKKECYQILKSKNLPETIFQQWNSHIQRAQTEKPLFAIKTQLEKITGEN